MMPQLSHSRPWRKARTVNSTSSAFSSKIPTLTEPTGSGATASDACVLSLIPDSSGTGMVPGTIRCAFFGAGADNATFSVRLIGWRRLGRGPGTQWFPEILAGLACTLSAMVGLAGSPVVDTDRIVDTITVTSGYEPVRTANTTNDGTFIRFSPANDLLAWVVVPTYGCERVEIDFDMDGATPATNGNMLYTF